MPLLNLLKIFSVLTIDKLFSNNIFDHEIVICYKYIFRHFRTYSEHTIALRTNVLGKAARTGEKIGEKAMQEGGGTTVGTSANWIIMECAAFVL